MTAARTVDLESRRERGRKRFGDCVGTWWRILRPVIPLILLGWTCLSISLRAQTITVFDIDVSGYPMMRAKFYVFDAGGIPVSGLTPSDILLFENSTPRPVTRVTCPPAGTPRPISSVLTIDISGSMGCCLGNCGTGMPFTRAAARGWVDALPLGLSECAITTFNTNAYINQDFTIDRAALIGAIRPLNANGGTLYDAALLLPPAGAIAAAAQGKHARIVVFLTDGKPNVSPSEAAIIAEAVRQQTVIYSVIIGSAAPQCVKNISEHTGGSWFDGLKTEEDVAAAFRQILMTATSMQPCTVEWTTASCEGIHRLEIAVPALGISAVATLAVPATVVPQLVYTPSRSLQFGETPPGTKRQIMVTMTAQGHPVTVEKIAGSNPLFTVTDYGGGNPPFTLEPGRSRELTVEFSPVDSAYQYGVFTMEGDVCIGGTLYADGGWWKKSAQSIGLTVTRPNGGEILIAGSDEDLTWEGVMPAEPVRLEYSTDGGIKWITITDSAVDLRYRWRVPKSSSDRCLLRATARPRPFVPISMILIPSGTFKMGDISGRGVENDEYPPHDVTITRPFLMSRTEVTQAQWESVMGYNPSTFKADSLPVEMVSWVDAVTYCNRRSRIEGLDTCYRQNGSVYTCDFNANGYRLPTEAEWEYACRGGTQTDFHTGDMANSKCLPLDSALDRAGWYCGNNNTGSSLVAGKEPNAFGLYDMHGNVWEWCWDWYLPSRYPSTPQTDPTGPSSGSRRITRGGSWSTNATFCRSASRGMNYTGSRSSADGFRVVRTP